MTLPESFLSRPIAHRAPHDIRAGRPENSRAALRAAVAQGYGIECGLQFSADGVPMVFHDEHLMRLTGRDATVAALTAEELGRLPLRHGDKGIPTLRKALALVAGRMPLLIEIKGRTGLMGATDGALEAATAEALRGYEEDAALLAFNPHSMIAMRDLAPDRPQGIVTASYDPSDPEWAAIPEKRRQRLVAIADYEAAGAALLCWTVRTPEAERAARRVADNVTFEGYLA